MFAISCFGAESFINEYEYGEMLYKHPRGVGCDKCHGEYGEGKTLAKYEIIKQKKAKEIDVIAPSLKDTDRFAILEATKKKRGVMPTYFLTASEADAIVFYLKTKNERLEEKTKQEPAASD